MGHKGNEQSSEDGPGLGGWSQTFRSSRSKWWPSIRCARWWKQRRVSHSLSPVSLKSKSWRWFLLTIAGSLFSRGGGPFFIFFSVFSFSFRQYLFYLINQLVFFNDNFLNHSYTLIHLIDIWEYNACVLVSRSQLREKFSRQCARPRTLLTLTFIIYSRTFPFLCFDFTFFVSVLSFIKKPFFSFPALIFNVKSYICCECIDTGIGLCNRCFLRTLAAMRGRSRYHDSSIQSKSF